MKDKTILGWCIEIQWSDKKTEKFSNINYLDKSNKGVIDDMLESYENDVSTGKTTREFLK